MPSKIKLEKSWLKLLAEEFEADYFIQLKAALVEEKKTNVVYPPSDVIFNALEQCPVNNVKVVILGQDPYHGPGQAHGLSFSVPDGMPKPPSLLNIFKEIVNEFGGTIPQSGNLEHWAKQGVLLLNSHLTVRAHQAGAHFGYGWETFTDNLIAKLATQREKLVFLLWGKHARMKKRLLPTNRGHVVLEAPHPSPLSAHRGFMGCGHFMKANEFLVQQGQKPIDWI